MPLPTTNLTAHFDASNNDDVIKTGSTSAVDGETVEEWEDDDGKDLSFWYLSDPSAEPTYRTSVPLMALACLDFDGTNDRMGLYDSAGVTPKSLANVLSASAKTVLLSIYVEAIVGSDASAFNNDGIFVDSGQFFGLHVKSVAGVHTLQGYNWDGNEDKVEATISLATSYVVMLRHNGTNLYMAINGGAESSVASGATSTTTGNIMLGRNGTAGSAYFNGRVGEVAMYNVDLNGQGSDLAIATSYFTNKWLSGGVTASPKCINTSNYSYSKRFEIIEY